MPQRRRPPPTVILIETMDFIKDLNIDKVRNLAEDAFNQVKPKTDVEVRVYEVLSHKNWGASGTLMNEIAQDTFDYERFLIVTKLMWEAIETPRPSAWRVIFKGLTLLEHLIKNGSERCVDDARNHSHLLRNLDKFNYYEGTVDRGVGVREKSKQVVEILGDDDRIREERGKARQLREKFAGRGTVASSSSGGGGGGGPVKYAGYGRDDDNWASSGKSGGGGGSSGGYGDSGIGSSGRVTGRYGEGGVDSNPPTRPTARSSPAVTTSRKSSKSTSSGTTKVKKIKKKEKKAVAVAPAAPEVDLFGFDSAPAISAPVVDDSFDAFQTAPVPAAPFAAAAVNNDDFGDFQQIAPTSAVQFDAFGSAPAPVQQSFDAFGAGGAAPSMMQQPSHGNGNTMNNAFGNMSMQNQQQQQIPSMMSAPAPAADNDDFGDFEDADPTAAKSTIASSDPLSNLISLDGLSKNTKKETKPANKPLDFSQPLGGQQGLQSMGGQQGFQGMGMGGQQQQPVLGTGQKGDIGEVFGQMLTQQQQQQQQQMRNQQQRNMGMNGSSGGGNNMGGMNNMGMMGGQQQMNMGMGGQQQQPQQQGMMNNTMMGNQQQMGGQPQGNMGMMGGNNNMTQGNMGMGGQQQGMMQGNTGMGGQQGQMNNMMGGQGQMNMMGGQQGNSNMMGNNNMGMMGGQSGQGFR